MTRSGASSWVIELELVELTTHTREIRSFVVADKPIILGRLRSCTICIAPRGNAGRRNTKITVSEGGQVIVEDLGPFTFVNGRYLSSLYALQPGDWIHVGDYGLRLVAPARPATPAAQR